MGIFKKEDKPQLASPASLPPLPKIDSNPSMGEPISGLPTLPETNRSSSINEDIIKSAMDDNELEQTYEVDPTKIRQIEFPSSPAKTSITEDAGSIESPKMPTKDEIFVKIDVFNKSQETLKGVQEKIGEVSAEIQELKEIKTKEIQELTAWDNELKEINSRLSRIDSSLFSEV